MWAPYKDILSKEGLPDIDELRRAEPSIDATPRQLDELAESYQHRRHPAVVEAAKRRWYRAVVRRAAAVVTWSHWAAESAVREYGADPSRLLVAHPGSPAPIYPSSQGWYLHRRPARFLPRRSCALPSAQEIDDG